MTTQNTEDFKPGPKAETGKPLVHHAPGTEPPEEYVAGAKAEVGKPLVHTAPQADPKAAEAEEDELLQKVKRAHDRAAAKE